MHFNVTLFLKLTHRVTVLKAGGEFNFPNLTQDSDLV